MHLDSVNDDEAVDSLNSSKPHAIGEAENNLSLEKKKNLILNSELELSKLVANQEIDRLKRECAHLKDYVSRLEEDRDIFRSREAKDLKRAKEILEYNEKNENFVPEINDLKRECTYFKDKVSRLEEDCAMYKLREAQDEQKVKSILENMEKNEEDFAKQLVELKVKNLDLELAFDACRKKCEGLVEENRRLKENGNAGSNGNEGIGVEIYDDADLLLYDEIEEGEHEDLTKKVVNAAPLNWTGGNEVSIIHEDAQIPQTPANNRMEIDTTQSGSDCDWNNILITPESTHSQSQCSSQPSDSDHSSAFTTDLIFPSRTALVDWVKQMAISLGFIIIIIKSEKNTPKRKARLLFACDRGGVYRSHAKKTEDSEKPEKKRARKRGTRKCNCPFFLRGLLLEGDSWKLKVENGRHNHEICESLEGHSYAGRLSEDEKNFVAGMYKTGAKPKEILSAIQRNGNSYSTIKTIYNAKRFGEALLLTDTDFKDSVTDVTDDHQQA